MVTTVVNIQHKVYDIFIGRPSILRNPYKIGVDGSRKEVIAKFKELFHNSTDRKQYAREHCKDKILGCYCKPLACHGDIIAEYLNGLEEDGK